MRPDILLASRKTPVDADGEASGERLDSLLVIHSRRPLSSTAVGPELYIRYRVISRLQRLGKVARPCLDHRARKGGIRPREKTRPERVADAAIR